MRLLSFHFGRFCSHFSVLAGPHPRSTFESLRSTLSFVEGSLSRGDYAPRSGRRRLLSLLRLQRL
jgi:hypothetical protein